MISASLGFCVFPLRCVCVSSLTALPTRASVSYTHFRSSLSLYSVLCSLYSGLVINVLLTRLSCVSNALLSPSVPPLFSLNFRCLSRFSARCFSTSSLVVCHLAHFAAPIVYPPSIGSHRWVSTSFFTRALTLVKPNPNTGIVLFGTNPSRRFTLE